jgi:hypothetical protein
MNTKKTLKQKKPDYTIDYSYRMPQVIVNNKSLTGNESLDYPDTPIDNADFIEPAYPDFSHKTAPQDKTEIKILKQNSSSDGNSIVKQAVSNFTHPIKEALEAYGKAPTAAEGVLRTASGLKDAVIAAPMSVITEPLGQLGYKLGSALGEKLPLPTGLLNAACTIGSMASKAGNSRIGQDLLAASSFIPIDAVVGSAVKGAVKVAKNSKLIAGAAKDMTWSPISLAAYPVLATKYVSKNVTNTGKQMIANAANKVNNVKSTVQDGIKAYQDGNTIQYVADGTKQYIKNNAEHIPEKIYDYARNNALNQYLNPDQFTNQSSEQQNTPRQVTISNLGGNDNTNDQDTQQTVPLGGSWGNMPLRYGTSGNPVLQHLMYRNQLQRK